jgi:glycosyltransferase involved in cell wall biosynthesis
MDEGSGVKVLMVVSRAQASVGGMQKQALSLASELQAQRVSVCVLGRGGKNHNVKGMQRPFFEEVNGHVKIVRLPIIRLIRPWSFLFCFFIWACINRNAFQIIHAHNAPLGVMACVVSWFVRKKVIIKIPGMKYVDYLNGTSLSRRVRRWILTKSTDRFIAVNAEMAKALREAGVAPEKIALIRNGIELTAFNGNNDRYALKISLLGDPKLQVALFVGRLAEEKGLDQLLAVWAALPSRDGRMLLIVGDGPLRTKLESQARLLGLFPTVRFVGHQTDVSKFYAVADLFVLPSKTEGMSNSLLEAMAAGLPAIASNVGGNKEAIQDQESGFLIDLYDTPGWAHVLLALLSDRDLRARIGNAARRRARDFDIRDVAQQYHHLYKAVGQR